jgi:hypothetical protein
MGTITLDTSALTIVILIQITFFWMWQYFYGEKTKIELAKGLNSFKSLPATIKKQFKAAVKEELEDMDWSDILPEGAGEASLLTQLFQNLPTLLDGYKLMKGDGSLTDLMKDVGEGALEGVSKAVKEETKK